MIPGEYILLKDPVAANSNADMVSITVVNTGDRPVQVGSHYHFFEVNKLMEFDRARSIGMRLNIPAGTAVRFEPGEEKKVELVSIGGKKEVYGFNNLVAGASLTPEGKKLLVEQAVQLGFKNKAG